MVTVSLNSVLLIGLMVMIAALGPLMLVLLWLIFNKINKLDAEVNKQGDEPPFLIPSMGGAGPALALEAMRRAAEGGGEKKPDGTKEAAVGGTYL